MKGMTGRLGYGIIHWCIGIFIMMILFPSGLILGAGNLDGYPVLQAEMAIWDNRIIDKPDHHIVKINEYNNSFPIDNYEGLYNQNIQVWISIVLVLLGSYVLVVGLMIYLSVRGKSPESKHTSIEKMEEYSGTNRRNR